jgi:hypothetical protein
MDALFAALGGTGVVGANLAQRWRTDAASATQPDTARDLGSEFTEQPRTGPDQATSEP